MPGQSISFKQAPAADGELPSPDAGVTDQTEVSPTAASPAQAWALRLRALVNEAELRLMQAVHDRVPLDPELRAAALATAAIAGALAEGKVEFLEGLQATSRRFIRQHWHELEEGFRSPLARERVDVLRDLRGEFMPRVEAARALLAEGQFIEGGNAAEELGIVLWDCIADDASNTLSLIEPVPQAPKAENKRWVLNGDRRNVEERAAAGAGVKELVNDLEPAVTREVATEKVIELVLKLAGLGAKDPFSADRKKRAQKASEP
jgi:hypothetical protein